MSTTASLPQGQDTEARGPSSVWSKPRAPSGKEVGKRLSDFIERGGDGLKNMYFEAGGKPNGWLKQGIKCGEGMAKKLITEMGCTGEVAKDLTVLTLYDVAILIGAFWW